MGKKYLLEIEENKDGSFAWSNFAPYAEPEPHAEVTADAYQRGYEQGQKDLRESCVPKDEEAYGIGYNEGYQRGLADAWDAVKKLARMDTDTSESITGYFGLHNIMHNLTASEVIEEIRAYEQAQKEKEEQIQVGDEVELKCGVSPAIYMQGTNGSDEIYLLFNDGSCGIHGRDEIECKTGRHFPEIAEVLAKMKETNNG